MQFKDCKQGYPIYVIDRKEITVKTGKVTNAPMSHFDNHYPNAGKMVVDLNVTIDGATTSYVMEDSAEIGYVGNLVITLNKESVQRELESIKSQSEQALDMMDYHREAVKKCDVLLKEYSPMYKERTEYAERLNGVEEKVDRLSDMMAEFINQQKTSNR